MGKGELGEKTQMETRNRNVAGTLGQGGRKLRRRGAVFARAERGQQCLPLSGKLLSFRKDFHLIWFLLK